MSLTTNQYFDVPIHEQGFSHYEYGAPPVKAAKRRFFQSGARWDEGFERVLLGRKGASPSYSLNLLGQMERGGQDIDEMEEDWEDGVMVVDS